MSYSVRYGGKKGRKVTLSVASDMVAVRFRGGQNLEQVVRATHARPEVAQLERVAYFPDASVAVLRVPTRRGAARVRDAARSAIGTTDVRFVGRVLRDRKSHRPVLYTENFYVRFASDAKASKCRAVLREHGLSVKRSYEQIKNAFFVAAPEGAGGEKVFDLAAALLEHELVERCHPELIRERSHRAVSPHQWHLKKTSTGGVVVDAHASVESAWRHSRGEGITVAVIDDGVDVGHPDFAGRGKVVHGRDVTRAVDDPRPKADAFISGIPQFSSTGDAHGTCCAGVAVANGKQGVFGVAPDAKLLPIRFASGLGSQAEADAFFWAVDHDADVVSCSWGPPDGAWYDPTDPLHQQVTPLPDSTRDALEYATTAGRGGAGCVITWAAGNGAESADNDGYASSEHVMAVAACNDRGTQSVYSDFGSAVWCSFPSNDFAFANRPDPLTPGIWITDRREGPDEGYNPHFSGGDAAGVYTDGFGGTSSACPGVAGVAALVLAKNPDLTWIEVCNVIAESCDRIDEANGDYDPSTGHSHLYGFGRVNARRAVELAAATL